MQIYELFLRLQFFFKDFFGAGCSGTMERRALARRRGGGGVYVGGV